MAAQTLSCVSPSESPVSAAALTCLAARPRRARTADARARSGRRSCESPSASSVALPSSRRKRTPAFLLAPTAPSCPSTRPEAGSSRVQRTRSPTRSCIVVCQADRRGARHPALRASLGAAPRGVPDHGLAEARRRRGHRSAGFRRIVAAACGAARASLRNPLPDPPRSSSSTCLRHLAKPPVAPAPRKVPNLQACDIATASCPPDNPSPATPKPAVGSVTGAASPAMPTAAFPAQSRIASGAGSLDAKLAVPPSVIANASLEAAPLPLAAAPVTRRCTPSAFPSNRSGDRMEAPLGSARAGTCRRRGDLRIRGRNATCHSNRRMMPVRRGATERRQNRWSLTRAAMDLLYAAGRRQPAPREEARAAAPALLERHWGVLSCRQPWPCGSRPGARSGCRRGCSRRRPACGGASSRRSAAPGGRPCSANPTPAAAGLRASKPVQR